MKIVPQIAAKALEDCELGEMVLVRQEGKGSASYGIVGQFDVAGHADSRFLAEFDSGFLQLRYLDGGASVISFGTDYELLLSDFEVDRDAYRRDPLNFLPIIDGVPHWVVRHAPGGVSGWQAVSCGDFKCRIVGYVPTLASDWQLRLLARVGEAPNDPIIRRPASPNIRVL